MLTEPGGPFINVDKLDLRKYATRPALAKVLCDYIIYHDHNPRKALELASLATVHVEYKDWWWKVRHDLHNPQALLVTPRLHIRCSAGTSWKMLLPARTFT